MSESGKTLRTPIPADRVKVKILDFQLTRGGTVEYTLDDKNVVKLTPQLNQVLVQIDEAGEIVLGPNGMPIYNFSFGVQTQVIPEKRTMYVPKPPSTAGTPPSSMTV